ncbi:MAG: hypothetical protein H0W73_18330 [Bacteroidetes bacterium]|nr:hypothetical protein [Bacteroidota bacterium]
MGAFTIISDTNATQSSLKSLYEYLSDFENFGHILPDDKVENFQYTETECSFDIKGITSMKIKKIDTKPYEFILFSSEGLAKFNFSLKAFFIGESSEKGECKIELMGSLNPFIKAMAEKPLTALTNSMSLKLSQLKLK